MQKLIGIIVVCVAMVTIFCCGSDGIKFEKMEKKQWKAAGFTIDQAKEWKRAGFVVHDAGRWKNDGFPIDEAQEWKSIGFDTRLARQWKLACETAAQTQEFLAAGFQKRSSEEILCLKSKGFSFNEIKDLKAIDINCRYATKWQRAGFSAAEIIAFVDAGFNPRSSVKNAEKWKNFGFTAADYIVLKESGFSEYASADAKAYKDAGYDTALIARLKKQNIPPSTLKEWEKEGFSVNETLSYVSFGIRISKPYIAKSWKESGLDLSQIQELVDCGFRLDSPNRYLEFQKLDLAFMDWLWIIHC